jgi:hypothetical protein
VQLYQGWNTPNSHQRLEAHPTFAILGRYAADNQADVLFLDDGGNDTTRAGILPGTAGWPPPCYAHVAPVLDQPGVLEFQYWFFYTFNGDIANFVPGSWGEHVGDWEHIILRVEDMQTITQVFYSAHSGQEWQDGQKLSFVPGTQHPIVYAARHSHANYIDNGVAGFHMHIPVVGNDMTKMGTAWDTWHRVIRVEWSAVPTVNQQDWIRYTGRWGQTPHNSYGDSPNGPAAPGRADFRRMPSGTRLAEVSTPNTVYIIAGGVRFPSTQQTGAVIVPDGFIGAFPTCPPACPDDGTLLQEADNPQIWAIWLGEKRPMPSVLPPPSDWHYPFPWTNQVSVVPAGSLSSIPAASR